MKKANLILVSAVGILVYGMIFLFSCNKTVSPPPPVSDIHLDSGLQLYLPFSGNFADSSGHGNSTTAVGGASLTFDEHGTPNSAFGGSGSGQRVLVTNNGSIKFDTAVTLACDLMLRAPGRYGIYEMVDNTTSTSYVIGFGTTANSPNNMDFIAANSLYSCENGTSSSNTTGDTSNFVPQPESWYNIVCTFYKGKLTTYMNGNMISSVSGGAPKLSICPNAKIIIGGWWDGDPASINGKMDEVRLYNRVLNADEIAQLANHFKSPN